MLSTRTKTTMTAQATARSCDACQTERQSHWTQPASYACIHETQTRTLSEAHALNRLKLTDQRVCPQPYDVLLSVALESI